MSKDIDFYRTLKPMVRKGKKYGLFLLRVENGKYYTSTEWTFEKLGYLFENFTKRMVLPLFNLGEAESDYYDNQASHILGLAVLLPSNKNRPRLQALELANKDLNYSYKRQLDQLEAKKQGIELKLQELKDLNSKKKIYTFWAYD